MPANRHSPFYKLYIMEKQKKTSALRVAFWYRKVYNIHRTFTHTLSVRELNRSEWKYCRVCKTCALAEFHDYHFRGK